MAEHVDDSTLDAAAEEEVAVEEEAVEVTQEEEVEEEVDPELEAHKESSRVGRRVSALESKMDSFINNAERLLASKEEVVEEIDPDMPVTMGEVKRMLEREAEVKKVDRSKYENSYVSSVAALSAGEDSDFANKVMDEMETNYNKEYSKDGGRDAEINWLKASNEVLKQGTKKKNPLTGPKTKVPLGIGGADTNTERGYVRPKLDAAAEDLIARSNFTDEQLERALTSTRVHSAGERNAKNV